MENKIVQVTTFPFGVCNPEPSLLLRSTGFEVRYNPFERRLRPEEVSDLTTEAHGIIAGTEPYTEKVIKRCKKLKVISRVGVGLDNVDLRACKDRGVIVTYTPDPPAEGVADLTVGQIVNLLRGIYRSNESVKSGFWDRIIGRLISEVKIGVLGVGRIGKRVVKRLEAFGAEVYGCDIKPDYAFGKAYNLKWVSKEKLFEICDLVTVHIPMSKTNYHCVGFEEMSRMKLGSFLVNTSRGPVVDESALLSLLQNHHLGGVALDVFEKEPYEGPLVNFENVIFTAHIGASASHCRYKMELGAAQDCIKVLSGKKPDNMVTEDMLNE